MTKGPVLIDLEEQDAPHVAEAPPVPDLDSAPNSPAMVQAAMLAARPASRVTRWFWGLAGALLVAVLSVAAWDFTVSLVARVPVLGWAVAGALGLLAVLALLILLREAAAIARMGRIDGLRRRAETALADDDLAAARRYASDLARFYANRPDLRWGQDRLSERTEESFDASAVLALVETELMAGLDKAAEAEIEAATRRVAVVTALVPLALADVVVALTASLRMIRRISEIYGGRSGWLGSWRLVRAVLAQLVAAGAMAVGDDLLEPVLGGSVLSKLSRRFGESLVNGALTARVGVAAMEVCRPVPFGPDRRPALRRLVRRALTGLFGRGTAEDH